MRPDAEPVPGVLVVRPDGNLFFGNISRVRLAVRDRVQAAEPPPHTVVLDLTDSYHLGAPVLDTRPCRRPSCRRWSSAWRLRLMMQRRIMLPCSNVARRGTSAAPR
ncbi:sodium-independent anion transporter [Streptomyces violaceorubidus]|uniref:sodium-independent anion transporter n=1 Tax=Streptomyces violaceorubidus TaxID=284042 RepID=UPI003CC90E47